MAAPLKAGAGVSVAKLIKMLNSASKVKKGKHDPKEMLGEDGEDLSIKDSAGAASVAKLLKMLKSASETKKENMIPEEMGDEDGEDLSNDEKVIDEQKLAEQEEIIRRITKKREV